MKDFLMLLRAVLVLIVAYLKNKFEKDAKIEKKREKLIGDLKNALKNKDVSTLTATFNKLNKL